MAGYLRKEELIPNPLSGYLMHFEDGELVGPVFENLELSELLGRPEYLQLIMATSNGHHKWRGLLGHAREFDFINPIGNRQLPIIISSAKPTHVNEDVYNREVIRDPGVIPALKTEQIKANQDMGLMGLNERVNFLEGINQAEASRRFGIYLSQYIMLGGHIDEGFLKTAWLDILRAGRESNPAPGLVVVGASDVAVYSQHPVSGESVALFQPGEQLSKDKVGMLLTSSNGGPIQFKIQFDIAVRILMCAGIPLNYGAGFRQESYVWINPLTPSELDEYWNTTDKDLMKRVPGGLALADPFLLNRVNFAQNWLRSNYSEVIEKQELGLRLRSNSPVLFDLIAELLMCIRNLNSCTPNMTANVRKGVSIFPSDKQDIEVAGWWLMHNVRSEYRALKRN